MMISIESKRTNQRTFNHRLTPAGRLLAVFAASLSLTACPSPDGGTPTPSKPKAWHVTTFAGSGVSGTEDGIGTGASFITPYGIAQSGDTLYVIDQIAHSIRTVHTTTARVGTIVTGNLARGSYAEGDGTVARFNLPRGIAAGAGGTLYVADFGNHRIREVRAGANAADTEVSLLAGTKDPGHRNGAGNTAQFNFPEGLALSGRTLYVADMNNHRIRAINLASGANNTVSTIAGNGKNDKVVDGPGATAQFNKPIGLAVSGSTLYVADSENHRIRAIDLANANYTVSTIAGDGTAKNTDGIGTAAQFSEPTGIAVSGSTLYVTSGAQIRKLEYR